MPAFCPAASSSHKVHSLHHHRYTGQLQAHDTFMGQACAYDLVVFVTFPEHHLGLAEQLLSKGCAGQQYALTVHNPSELSSLGAPCSLHALEDVLHEAAMHACTA